MHSKWTMIAPFVTIGIGMILGFGMGLSSAEDITEAQYVSSFNDGFIDGSCHDGQDGFGNICINN